MMMMVPYFQGSSIIRMLEGFVGKEKFKEGLSVSTILQYLLY